MKGGDCVNKEDAGARLKSLRLKKKETLAEVGRAVGVTAQSVQAYEAGKKTPSDSVKIKLAEHFNRTVQFIFFDN